MRIFLFAVLILPTVLVCAPVAVSRGSELAAPSLTTRKLEDLLERLRSKHFKVRAAAERELSTREDAAPALRQFLKSSDRDLRQRVGRILEALTQRRNRQARERLEVLARNGKIDQVVERLVRWQDWGGEEDAAWQVVTAFAGRLLDLDKTKFPTAAIDQRTFPQRAPYHGPPLPPGTVRTGLTFQEWQSQLPFRDFTRYKKRIKPIHIAAPRVTLARNGHFVIRAEEVTLDAISSRDLIACTGSVTCNQRRLGLCGIFAGGSVAIKRIFASVVVCDGEFKTEFASLCIIIARGPVTITEGGNNCLIVSGDKITIPKWLRGQKQASMMLRENEAVPLGFIRFFNTADAGITVAAAGKEVAVKVVTPGKPFARARLRSGDVLISVDGTSVPSPESFRRLLRRKLAEGKDATFKIRRGDKSLAIRVPCKG